MAFYMPKPIPVLARSGHTQGSAFYSTSLRAASHSQSSFDTTGNMPCPYPGTISSPPPPLSVATEGGYRPLVHYATDGSGASSFGWMPSRARQLETIVEDPNE
ncbi:hypothetical protein H4R34_001456 [Dimargaris verticillata]|uniref:Uncharacterized protein n=1 Tax=Dimargaris verticillata TaxID=2761393 RepID=A0A9W8EAX3_9FUNG|nr:hypothetical protein H4R34_001456 [Dimargaris verticillata]